MKRFVVLSFVAVALIAPLYAQRSSQSNSADLRELDVSDWDCPPEGDAAGDGDQERNEMKNRQRFTHAASAAVQDLDWKAFLNLVQGYDQTLTQLQLEDDSELTKRSTLSAKSAKKLGEYEKTAFSITGYLVIAYPGPKETCNCHEQKYHDWHMELYEQPLDHVPAVGDPTGIICEVTPYTEARVHNEPIKLRDLAAFMRQGKTNKSTGHPAHKVKITGYLLWDDAHNSESQLGPTIEDKNAQGLYEPWRQTAWEIHPVFSIEDLGTD